MSTAAFSSVAGRQTLLRPSVNKKPAPSWLRVHILGAVVVNQSPSEIPLLEQRCRGLQNRHFAYQTMVLRNASGLETYPLREPWLCRSGRALSSPGELRTECRLPKSESLGVPPRHWGFLELAR